MFHFDQPFLNALCVLGIALTCWLYHCLLLGRIKLFYLTMKHQEIFLRFNCRHLYLKLATVFILLQYLLLLIYYLLLWLNTVRSIWRSKPAGPEILHWDFQSKYFESRGIPKVANYVVI